MATDDRNSEFDNLTITDSLTGPDGTTYTGALGGGGSGGGVTLENTDGIPLVTDATAIHAGTGLEFADDTDGTGTLNVPADGITATELDESLTPTWTGEHTFSYTGDNGITVTSSGGDATVYIDAPGVSGHAPRLMLQEAGTDEYAFYINPANGDLNIFNYTYFDDVFSIDNDMGTVTHLRGTIRGQRGDPTTTDIAAGENLVYNSDGSGAGGAGDLVVARNDAGTIETHVIDRTVAEGTVALSGGSAVVATGVTTTGTHIDVKLDPSGGGANATDVKAAARAFWDNSAGEYFVEILEDGTDVGNPTIGYHIVAN